MNKENEGNQQENPPVLRHEKSGEFAQVLVNERKEDTHRGVLQVIDREPKSTWAQKRQELLESRHAIVVVGEKLEKYLSESESETVSFQDFSSKVDLSTIPQEAVDLMKKIIADFLKRLNEQRCEIIFLSSDLVRHKIERKYTGQFDEIQGQKNRFQNEINRLLELKDINLSKRVKRKFVANIKDYLYTEYDFVPTIEEFISQYYPQGIAQKLRKGARRIIDLEREIRHQNEKWWETTIKKEEEIRGAIEEKTRLGELLFEAIVGKEPKGKIDFVIDKGFYVMIFRQEDEYEKFYKAFNFGSDSKAKSTGSFFTTFKTYVSSLKLFIMVRGGPFRTEESIRDTIVHEKQHAINDQFFQRFGERFKAIPDKYPFNEIKNEILAFIKAGDSLEWLLTSDLYTRLYQGKSAEGEVRRVVQDTMKVFEDMRWRPDENERALLVNHLIYVPFRKIPRSAKRFIEFLQKRNYLRQEAASLQMPAHFAERVYAQKYQVDINRMHEIYDAISATKTEEDIFRIDALESLIRQYKALQEKFEKELPEDASYCTDVAILPHLPNEMLERKINGTIDDILSFSDSISNSDKDNVGYMEHMIKTLIGDKGGKIESIFEGEVDMVQNKYSLVLEFQIGDVKAHCKIWIHSTFRANEEQWTEYDKYPKFRGHGRSRG